MKQQDKSPAARLAVVDLARGAALIGMAVYHLSWDFAYFHLVPPEFPSTAPMRLYSHAVAAAFLLLAGASLALAHPSAVRWRAYWRRLAIVGGAAALLTAATLFFDPEDAILFGILHCIAAASLLSAPLLLAPPAFAFVAAGFAFAAPILFASPFFNTPALDWIGLETVLPRTLDWRPLFALGEIGSGWEQYGFAGRLCSPPRSRNGALRAGSLARSPGRAGAVCRSISSISRSCSRCSLPRPKRPASAPLGRWSSFQSSASANASPAAASRRPACVPANASSMACERPAFRARWAAAR